MKKFISGLIKRYNAYIQKRRLEKRYHKDVISWIKSLRQTKQLTQRQKSEIQEFYNALIGKDICLDTHRYFYSRTGIFSKEYIPIYLYYSELIHKANLMDHKVLADKNLCDVIFSGVKQPKTFLKNINGYYYHEGKPVSRDLAIKLCSNLNDKLIKPTTSTHGNGVKLLNVRDGVTSIDGMTIEQVFDKYKKDFLIQERIKQHERMAALNPTSVNTLRIVTFRSGMEVLIVYAVVRIGRSGQVIDNQCAGGLSTYIDENGKLGKFSYGGYNEDNILMTDSGITLDGYVIPSFDKAIEFVKDLHYRVPYFDLVGWDISIDESGEPVLVEWNSKPGLSQSAFGPGFGKYTERIISELWPRKNNFNRLW